MIGQAGLGASKGSSSSNRGITSSSSGEDGDNSTTNNNPNGRKTVGLNNSIGLSARFAQFGRADSNIEYLTRKVEKNIDAVTDQVFDITTKVGKQLKLKEADRADLEDRYMMMGMNAYVHRQNFAFTGKSPQLKKRIRTTLYDNVLWSVLDAPLRELKEGILNGAIIVTVYNN